MKAVQCPQLIMPAATDPVADKTGGEHVQVGVWVVHQDKTRGEHAQVGVWVVTIETSGGEHVQVGIWVYSSR